MKLFLIDKRAKAGTRISPIYDTAATTILSRGITYLRPTLKNKVEQHLKTFLGKKKCHFGRKNCTCSPAVVKYHRQLEKTVSVNDSGQAR